MKFKYNNNRFITVIILLLVVVCLTCIVLYFLKVTTKTRENFEQITLIEQIPKPKIVHLWIIFHANHHLTDTVEFMYKPMSQSIIQLINYLYSDIIIDYKYFGNNKFQDAYYDDIKDNDMLIVLGHTSTTPYDLLEKRGVYTIQFHTEPSTDKYMVDEIWTYSRQLFNNYEKSHGTQIIKFIPVVCEKNVPSVPYIQKDNKQIKLAFIGFFAYRGNKSNMLFENAFIKDNTVEVSNLWDDDIYNNFMTSEPRIYLNLTKDGTSALPACRLNKLLDYKSIIISEHTNEVDEELYKDIIYFCNLDKIGETFKMLSDKSGEELQTISDEIYTKYYNNFCCENALNLIQCK